MGCGESKPKTHGGTKKGSSTRGGTKKGGKTQKGKTRGGSHKSKKSTKHGGTSRGGGSGSSHGGTHGPPHPATAGSHIPSEGHGPPSGYGMSSGGPSVGSGGDFRDKVARAPANQLLVIRFFKIDCEKCLSVGHFYQGLVARFPQVIFLDANMARNIHAIGEMNIHSVPTFVAFKNHQELGRYVGTDTREVEALIARNL